MAGEPGGPSRDLVSVLHLGHLTDFQIADVQSPGRFEFFEQLRGRPGDESFVPAFRPQETLATHAVAAMVTTLNRMPASPETGAPLGLCISTGDSLVVLASHHGLDTMVNERQDPAGPEQDHPRVTAGALEALLHRFGNVVLWLNGYRHLNDVQPRPDRSGRTNGSGRFRRQPWPIGLVSQGW